MPHRPVDADSLERLADAYTRFAREARGRSLLYEELASRTARDRELLGVLATLPRPKRQPNLLLAAVRYLCGTPDGWEPFRRSVFERHDDVVAVMLAHRTQTNEPARCATLQPLLSQLPQPLALLEVGASAGLCLLPDRYAYDFDGHVVAPRQQGVAAAPTFACRASASTPLPDRGVDVVWRAGLDLNPIDVHDADQVAWLEALVWPGEGARLALLRSALEVARADPPRVVRGDLRRDLGSLAAEAPPEATLVVFHTAVLAYVDDAHDREAFAEAVGALDAVWIANESPRILLRGGPPREPWPSGRFLLTRDRRPIAWTDGHGTTIEWLG